MRVYITYFSVGNVVTICCANEFASFTPNDDDDAANVMAIASISVERIASFNDLNFLK